MTFSLASPSCIRKIGPFVLLGPYRLEVAVLDNVLPVCLKSLSRSEACFLNYLLAHCGEGKRRKEFAEWHVAWRAEWHNYAKYEICGMTKK